MEENEDALGAEVEASWGRLQSHLRFVCMHPMFLADVVMQACLKHVARQFSISSA